MSFLYDQEVYKSIISGELKKIAQDLGLTPNQVAKKLVARLSQDNGVSNKINISTNSPTPVGLGVSNLNNIGQLLEFLDKNQIMVDGERLVYDANEHDSLADAEKEKLGTITKDGSSRAEDTGDLDSSNYYVNFASLTKYVQHLQDKSKNDDNDILKAMVGKIIDQVNRVHPKSGLSRNQKSIPGQSVNNISDDTLIGMFGNKEFNSKSKTVNSGPGSVLYAKDLKSREALNAWMQTSPEAQIITYDENDHPNKVKYSDVNADKCFIMNMLYNHANRLWNNSSSDKDTEKYSFFKNRIIELAPQFTGPNGQCSINSSSTTPAAGNTIQTGYNSSKNQGQAGASNDIIGAIGRIISALPLYKGGVDLDRIFRFNSELRRLINNIDPNLDPESKAAALQRNNRINGYIIDLESKMNELQAMTNGGDSRYSFNEASDQFIQNFKQRELYGHAMGLLFYIVQLTRKIIEDFYSAYQNTMSPEGKSLVLGQIGSGSSSNSLYSSNIRDLNNLNDLSIIKKRQG